MSNRALDFEYMVRMFLGDKAFHIAGSENNDTHRRSWLRKVIKRIIKRLDNIETTTRHKKMLLAVADSLHDILKSRKTSPWDVNYKLFRLCGLLLGFDSIKGVVLFSPFFYQTKGQYYGSIMIKGGDPLQDYKDNKNAISIRKRLIRELKEEGLDDFKIALVFNISEYQVKKLLKDL